MPVRSRLLVCVIAYQAENTLAKVLERIPRSVFEAWDTEILVVDNASADRTYAIGCAYQEAHPDLPLTVLRNAHNQGYGGNQKVGYAYAIAERFDVVAMVHGDGQYAPAVNQALIWVSKTLFAYQIFVEAETTPDVAFVLADSLARRPDSGGPVLHDRPAAARQ